MGDLYILPIDIAIFLFQFSISVQIDSTSNANHNHFIDIFVSQPHFVMHFVAIQSHTIKYRLVRGMCIGTFASNIQRICTTLHYTRTMHFIHNATISFDCRCSFNTNILRIFFNFLNTKCSSDSVDYKNEKQKETRFCSLVFQWDRNEMRMEKKRWNFFFCSLAQLDFGAKLVIARKRVRRKSIYKMQWNQYKRNNVDIKYLAEHFIFFASTLIARLHNQMNG